MDKIESQTCSDLNFNIPPTVDPDDNSPKIVTYKKYFDLISRY